MRWFGVDYHMCIKDFVSRLVDNRQSFDFQTLYFRSFLLLTLVQQLYGL